MASLLSTNIPIQTMSSILDINSPYYVHPSDNPALPLVTPLLNDQNYHQWARAMEVSLTTKQKLSFIDGTIRMPIKSDPIYPAWERANNMVISWINRSVNPSISHSIIWIKKAPEVWEELKERFSQGNLYRIGDLQDSLSNFKQGESTVSNYYTEVKTIWDEIDNLRPLPVYNCVDPTICTAEIGTKKNCEEDKIVRFLKGLNDAYSGVRSQIMVMEPLPSMSKVLSLVTQQETQLYGLDIDAKAMAVTGNWKKGGTPGRGSIQGRRPPNSPGRGSWIKGASPGKYCSHCKKTGHTIEVCYRLHGFPANFQFTKNEQVNSITTNSSKEEGQQQQTGSKNDQDGTIFGLTQQQYQGLVNMLQQNNSIVPKHEDHNVGHVSNVMSIVLGYYKTEESGNFGTTLTHNNSSWILDSGATDHICSNLALYSVYYKIRPIKVRLPNGNLVTTEVSGSSAKPNLAQCVIFVLFYLQSFIHP
ncbi:PREDICTED: uncharacterized protein LOC109361887 [Lupinus angustifolius]|uniref:uncharacterized protein LOC109361887 n=1 Tax=Lupinus angustifolius TaxID=3871 RepID=UPI00092ED271|nr:PREDICTED: uncharacterized protein LOC109361887 [Lupinus angustifolius]